jgi:cytochrome c-type biogenesis protein CcmH
MAARRKPPIALAVAVFLAATAGVGLAAASTAETPTRQQIAQALTCQCGCGLTVANCNHPNCNFSVPLRAQIDSMIGRGLNRAQIIGLFRARYGEKILSAPTTEGFNLLAWVMPFAAIMLGGGLITLAAMRWHRAAPAPDADAPALPERPLDRELRRRLDAELKEQL